MSVDKRERDLNDDNQKRLAMMMVVMTGCVDVSVSIDVHTHKSSPKICD